MKTLSGPASTASKRPWAKPLYLLQIDFTSPSAKTLRFSDRYLQALGQQWLPFVADWGSLEEALNTVDVGGRPSTASVTLFNTKAIEGKDRLSDLIRTPLNLSGTFEWAFAKVTTHQLFDGLSSGDEVPLAVFYLEDPTEIDEPLLTLRMSDQSFVLEDKMNLLRVTVTDFPNADPDDIGKVIPVPFGVLTNIPALAVVAGAQTTLAKTLKASDKTVEVTDTSRFPATGTIEIDVEQMTYSGKTATSFTGVVRKATAVSHSAGAVVMEVRSGPQAYRYVVGENKGNFKIKAVTNVKVKDILQTSGITVTLDDTTLVSGRSFAVINFASTPKVLKEIVAEASGGGATSATKQATNTPKPMLLCVIAGQILSKTATLTLPKLPSGLAVKSVQYRLAYRVTQTSVFSLFRFRTQFGKLEETINSGPVLGPRTVSFKANKYQNIQLTLTLTGLAGFIGTACLGLTVDSLEAVVETTGEGLTLSGNSVADVLFGAVTCDVEGLQDDASGTISGTPNLLLENPADVTKAILLACFPGITASDLGTTWASTRSSLATAGFKWATLLEGEKFSDLRRKLGEQARSVLYLEGGKWEYKFLADAPASQLTLDYTKDVWKEQLRVSRTPRAQVKNTLWVYSQRDYRRTGDLGDRYRRTKREQDLTGFADALQEDLELDLVQDTATADALGAFWLGQWKRQRLMAELTAWWNALSVEKVDYLAISNHPVLSAHGGTSLVFRVTSKRYELGEDNPGRIRLSLMETNA